MERLVEAFNGFRGGIRAINQKYSKPRIQMTPMVKFWLLMLRLYLIGMLVLLAYKFVTLVSQ